MGVIAEGGLQARLGAEGFAQPNTGDGEVLGDFLLEIGALLLQLVEYATAVERDLAGKKDRRRHNDGGQKRQRRAQRDHGDGRRHRHREVRGDRGGGVRDHRLHARDVVDQPRLDLSPTVAREKSQGLTLEVTKDVDTQRVHDLLAHPGGDQRLQHPDRLRDHSQPDHADHQHKQQRHILARDRVVDGLLDQKRLHDGERGGRDDERDHHDEAASIRRKQPRDPLEAHGCALELGKVVGTFLLRYRRAEIETHNRSTFLACDPISLTVCVLSAC